jgi:hypothetical protein
MGLAWGATMTLSGLVQNLSGALAVRFFLGGENVPLTTWNALIKVTEAGFFPAALAVCGDWYHPLNLQVRIAFFYTMGQFSGAFGGLLAYAIHYMDGAGGLASWRW